MAIDWNALKRNAKEKDKVESYQKQDNTKPKQSLSNKTDWDTLKKNARAKDEKLGIARQPTTSNVQNSNKNATSWQEALKYQSQTQKALSPKNERKDFAQGVIDKMSNQERLDLVETATDLNKSKNGTYINFYDDDIMHDKDVVYTYNNIPAECMRLVDVLRP